MKSCCKEAFETPANISSERGGILRKLWEKWKAKNSLFQKKNSKKTSAQNS